MLGIMRLHEKWERIHVSEREWVTKEKNNGGDGMIWTISESKWDAMGNGRV